MPSGEEITAPIETALLSAVAVGSGDQFNPAIEEICGTPLISLQIRNLQSLGIKRFLIESEQLTGAFLTLVDNLKARDVDVEMIRSPKDLASALGATDKCLIFAPGIHVAPNLLSKLLNHDQPLLATVDGRDENSEFERIDLNTRWAGIAIVDHNLVQNIAELPEGWSLTSAILRSALQSDVEQQGIGQEYLASGALQVTGNSNDIERLTRVKLNEASDRQGGLIEAKIYAPLARLLTLRLPFDHGLVGMVAAVLALATLFSSFSTFAVITAVLGILSVFCLTVNNHILHITRRRETKFLSHVSWCLLFAATLHLGFKEVVGNIAFMAAIAGGVLLYSGKLDLITNLQRILPSPALLSWLLFVAAIISKFAVIFPIFVAAQVVALLYVQFAQQKNITELNRP